MERQRIFRQMRLLADVDIAMHTSPYPGGLTTCEVLYMGVPVVTMMGNRHGARFGYSFLSNVGIKEFVAYGKQDYVNIAVAAAQDKQLLCLLRHNLREMMQKSPLMNDEMYMRDLEYLYMQLLCDNSKGEQ